MMPTPAHARPAPGVVGPRTAAHDLALASFLTICCDLDSTQCSAMQTMSIWTSGPEMSDKNESRCGRSE
eukprot:7561693-Alexandrium_andersonii.AAC.1